MCSAILQRHIGTALGGQVASSEALTWEQQQRAQLEGTTTQRLAQLTVKLPFEQEEQARSRSLINRLTMSSRGRF
jgi:hypothetical protein